MRGRRAVGSGSGEDTQHRQRHTGAPDPVTAALGDAVGVMLRHAIAIGKQLPPGSGDAVALVAAAEVGTLGGRDMHRLIAHYDTLCRVVAPATPVSLRSIERSRAPRLLRFLGPVPFVHRMLAVAVASLVTFIAVSLSHVIHQSDGDIFKSSGWPLLANLVFLLAAAGMGASFQLLMQASRMVRQRAFDPAYEAGYWATFVLGLLGGLMLSELIPVGGNNVYSRPLLALLGGFSAKVVYRILSRLIDAVSSVVAAESVDAAAAAEQAMRVRLGQEVADTRMRAASQLFAARKRLGPGVPDDVFDKLIAGLLDGGADGGVIWPEHADDADPAPVAALAPVVPAASEPPPAGPPVTGATP